MPLLTEATKKTSTHFRSEQVMFRLNCDNCGQPATIHETVIEDGDVITRHFCQEHGVAPLQAADLGLETPQSAEELLHRFSAAERGRIALLHRLTHRRT
jgi:hypothetical protein